MLGQDYVAFRDSEGRVGYLDEGCPHRNVSLVLARNEDCGLRCIFHGWKVDVTGQVVETPTHTPNPEAFAAKITTRRYATVDAGGLLWVWLGESDPAPFPHLPFTVLPDSHVWVTATECACNWLQGVEATLDTAHIGTLHKAYMEAYSANDSAASIAGTLDVLAPRYDVERTEYGVDAIGTRMLSDRSRYVRTTKWVMPFVSLVPGSPGSSGRDVDGVIFIVSPVDDTHHQLFFGFWANEYAINDGLYVSVPEAQRAVVGDRPFDVNNFGGFSGGRDDNWGQDRNAMARGHFSGFTGNLLQEDTVTQISMGPITDRTRGISRAATSPSSTLGGSCSTPSSAYKRASTRCPAARLARCSTASPPTSPLRRATLTGPQPSPDAKAVGRTQEHCVDPQQRDRTAVLGAQNHQGRPAGPSRRSGGRMLDLRWSAQPETRAATGRTTH